MKMRSTVGVVFEPTEEQLIEFLRWKLEEKGDEVEGLKRILECNLYGEEPWELWDRFGGDDGRRRGYQDLYLFTRLNKLSKKGRGSRICRRVGKGKGTWSGAFSLTLCASTTNVPIAVKKHFRYENQECPSHHGAWILHEFSLLHNQDYVVCRLRKKLGHQAAANIIKNTSSNNDDHHHEPSFHANKKRRLSDCPDHHDVAATTSATTFPTTTTCSLIDLGCGNDVITQQSEVNDNGDFLDDFLITCSDWDIAENEASFEELLNGNHHLPALEATQMNHFRSGNKVDDVQQSQPLDQVNNNNGDQHDGFLDDDDFLITCGDWDIAETEALFEELLNGNFDLPAVEAMPINNDFGSGNKVDDAHEQTESPVVNNNNNKPK